MTKNHQKSQKNIKNWQKASKSDEKQQKFVKNEESKSLVFNQTKQRIEDPSAINIA